MTKITLKTTREDLTALTVAALKTLAVQLGLELNIAAMSVEEKCRGLKKDELVDYVWTYLVTEIQGHLQAEADRAAEAHAKQVAAEAADRSELLNAVLNGLVHIEAEIAAKKDKSQAKLAEDAVSNLAWHAEDLFKSDAQLAHLRQLIAFLQGEGRAEQTIDEIVKTVEAEARQALDRALRTPSQGSNPFRNATELAAFAGTQWWAKVVRQIADQMARRDVNPINYRFFFAG